ncbi:hypothetical protein CFIMG_006832RA [Ceratocystis fimbriata CBS 114723]|uniref:R3H-associated N-terminal domain-containing protein n=1 Tax=Ceratocystis fimbriata CBS 114723 TaxID=1035309 RepID=A0A2C5WTV7_9PEZI|nr:hypothetical protein CFIMG_006832RA [Ceratocystis fimbriata CBS 114723]
MPPPTPSRRSTAFNYDSDDLWIPATAVPSAPSVSAASETDRSTWAIPSDPPTPQLAGAALSTPALDGAVSVPRAPAATNAPVDIEAWTASALQSLSITTVQTGADGAQLQIPLVDPPLSVPVTRRVPAAQIAASRLIPRRAPPTKRELMVKGNEGSRARRRWENNNLVHVPNVTPPSAEDMLPRPTHPVTTVPYQVASAWDTAPATGYERASLLRDQAAFKFAAAAYARKTQQLRSGLATGLAKGEVPRDLRETAKRSPVVRAWVRALEEPLRKWVAEQKNIEGGVLAETDVETETEVETEAETDDEGWVRVDGDNFRDGEDVVLYTGRRSAKEVSDPHKQAPAMVFDAIGDDETAAFKRWLAHAISEYYGLESYSVTLANPTRRVVYVGASQPSTTDTADKNKTKKKRRKHRNHMHARLRNAELPRPLWEVVC